MRVFGLDSYRSVSGFCGQDNVSIVSINRGKFLKHPRKYQLIEKFSTTSNYLINRRHIN
jgi:hypothetical protein